MIKLFRNIRKNLLAEGKITKYLKYAIGEIILVVIGILIALSINNWNEYRKQKAKANSYLKSMLIDLNSDTENYTNFIEGFKKDVERNSIIFKDKTYQEQSIDSIFSLIPSIFGNYKVVDQTYQKIKNSGLSDELGSIELNDAINRYYSQDIVDYATFIDYDKEYSLKSNDFWFDTNDYEIPTSDGSSYSELPFSENENIRKEALIKKIESNRARNWLRKNIGNKYWGIQMTTRTRTKARKLIELINEELRRKP
ncbi:hypothetical protein SAMN03097699_0053 [Flavobacteriaceae bacterium MAR_2010_188]|nr:hypothetical protein SAMN03097699_0053 [Flavobacteriaceae bacterium MAR_2010_188]